MHKRYVMLSGCCVMLSLCCVMLSHCCVTKLQFNNAVHSLMWCYAMLGKGSTVQAAHLCPHTDIHHHSCHHRDRCIFPGMTKNVDTMHDPRSSVAAAGRACSIS
jgi:hypothetical protein